MNHQNLRRKSLVFIIMTQQHHSCYIYNVLAYYQSDIHSNQTGIVVLLKLQKDASSQIHVVLCIFIFSMICDLASILAGSAAVVTQRHLGQRLRSNPCTTVPWSLWPVTQALPRHLVKTGHTQCILSGTCTAS